MSATETRPEEYLTAAEVARTLRISVPTVAAMRRKGLVSTLVGVRKHVYRESDVVAYLARINGVKVPVAR